MTLVEKVQLLEKQSDELELRKLQELQKRKIEGREDEKQEILAVTKGVEAVYQKVLKNKQKTAAEKSKKEMQKNFEREIVTEIKPAGVFHKAEDYHQNYLAKRGLKTC